MINPRIVYNSAAALLLPTLILVSTACSRPEVLLEINELQLTEDAYEEPADARTYDLSGYTHIRSNIYRDSLGHLCIRYNSSYPGEEDYYFFRYTIDGGCGGEGKCSLDSVLDVETLNEVSNSYMKDKRHVYTYYVSCATAYLTLLRDVDPARFRVWGNSGYATDGENVFFRDDVVVQADLKTFHVPVYRTESQFYDCCVAVDKNYYYEFSSPYPEEYYEELNAVVRHFNP